MQFTCTPFKVIKRMLTRKTIWKSNTTLLVRNRKALLSKMSWFRTTSHFVTCKDCTVKVLVARCRNYLLYFKRETSLADCINKQPNVRHISNMGFHTIFVHRYTVSIWTFVDDQVKIRQNSSRWRQEPVLCWAFQLCRHENDQAVMRFFGYYW